jgi:hypothetical protein
MSLFAITFTHITYATGVPSGTYGWYNPDVGYCDTGGIAACIKSATN